MLSQRVMDIFDDHHRRATTIIGAQRSMLTADAVPDPAALARHRWELLRALVEFELFKHRDIFDPVIRHGAPSIADRARIMKQECTELGAEVRAFVAHWSNGNVGEKWQDFRVAKLALFDRIEHGLIGQRRGIAMMIAAPPRPVPVSVMAGGAARSADPARQPLSTYAGRR